MSAKSSQAPETPQAEPLFVPAPQPRMTAGMTVLFLASLVFMLGGFYVLSLAFSVEDAIAPWVLVAGTVISSFGFWLGFGITPKLARD